MQGGEGIGEEVSIEELASNLSTYKDQLQQVILPLSLGDIIIACYVLI